MPKVSTIAIDGPVASGKTVVGRRLAKKLGFQFLDTGLMYRAVTLAALQSSVPLSDDTALAALASEARIAVSDTPRGARVYLNNQDVTDFLRDPEVEAAVSRVSEVAGVRTVLVAKQQEMASTGPIVMAGRDIGTVVLADADVKVYLQASVQERAKRRHVEMVGTEDETSVDAVQEKLEARDLQDSQRAASPLRAADDAQVIHTDGLSLEQVVEQIARLVAARS